jgi:hypothetical protein
MSSNQSTPVDKSPGTRGVASASIEIQDTLQEAAWIGALSGWIEIARGVISQIRHAETHDPALAKLLKKHDIAATSAYWDCEESTALTMLLAHQTGLVRQAMQVAEEMANV